MGIVLNSRADYSEVRYVFSKNDKGEFEWGYKFFTPFDPYIPDVCNEIERNIAENLPLLEKDVLLFLKRIFSLKVKNYYLYLNDMHLFMIASAIFKSADKELPKTSNISELSNFFEEDKGSEKYGGAYTRAFILNWYWTNFKDKPETIDQDQKIAEITPKCNSEVLHEEIDSDVHVAPKNESESDLTQIQEQDSKYSEVLDW